MEQHIEDSLHRTPAVGNVEDREQVQKVQEFGECCGGFGREENIQQKICRQFQAEQPAEDPPQKAEDGHTDERKGKQTGNKMPQAHGAGAELGSDDVPLAVHNAHFHNTLYGIPAIVGQLDLVA